MPGLKYSIWSSNLLLLKKDPPNCDIFLLFRVTCQRCGSQLDQSHSPRHQVILRESCCIRSCSLVCLWKEVSVCLLYHLDLLSPSMTITFNSLSGRLIIFVSLRSFSEVYLIHLFRKHFPLFTELRVFVSIYWVKHLLLPVLKKWPCVSDESYHST